MIHNLGKSTKTVLICFLFLAGIIGCKDDYNSVVPDVPIYIDIPLANRSELTSIGNHIKLSGGYGGIIIFHVMADNSNPFLAYDGVCPYDLPSVYSVEIEEGAGVAACPHCESEYILFDGSGTPIKGPAIEPLKQYKTFFANGIISVRN